MGIIGAHLGTKLGTTASDDASKETLRLLDEAFARLGTSFDNQAGDDPFALLDLVQKFHGQVSSGNFQVNTPVTPSPVTPVAALGTGSPVTAPTSNPEVERIGTEALAMVGGDVTKANGLLSMLEKVVLAGPEAAVFAGQLFDGLTGDQIKAAGPNLGDLVITIVRDVANNKDTIVSRGLTAELESTVALRRDIAKFDGDLKSLLHKIGAGTKLADVQTALDTLRTNAGQAVLATQARTTSLNNIGTALGLTRGSDTDDQFEVKLVDAAKKAVADVTSLTTKFNTADGDVKKAEKIRKDLIALARHNNVTVDDTDTTPQIVEKMITEKGGFGKKLSNI